MAERFVNWIEASLAGAPREAFQRRLRQELEGRIHRMTITGIREGFSTVTPYLTAVDIERVMAFARETFGAVETGRSLAGGGHFHYEMRIGDSMLMCFGGKTFQGPDKPVALHVYVPDTDAAYGRALEAGGESLSAPEDKPYGERQAGVKDAAGNLWFIATRRAGVPVVEGMRMVTPYLLARNALGLIEFLKEAFGAKEIGVFQTPQGALLHGALRIGDAVLEMGEAEPMPGTFYLYVPDADAVYEQAVRAGAKSLLPPADQPYGDRLGVVEDAWGHGWCIATHLGR